MKILFPILNCTLLVAASALSFAADRYDRKDFNYRSYKPNVAIGFYTGKTCDFINIDHIVSLKDAYESGAANWSASKKKAFANDRRSRDGKGLDYQIVSWCEYVIKYHTVKIKYGLSFGPNNGKLFRDCNVVI